MDLHWSEHLVIWWVAGASFGLMLAVIAAFMGEVKSYLALLVCALLFPAIFIILLTACPFPDGSFVVRVVEKYILETAVYFVFENSK